MNEAEAVGRTITGRLLNEANYSGRDGIERAAAPGRLAFFSLLVGDGNLEREGGGR